MRPARHVNTRRVGVGEPPLDLWRKQSFPVRFITGGPFLVILRDELFDLLDDISIADKQGHTLVQVVWGDIENVSDAV